MQIATVSFLIPEFNSIANKEIKFTQANDKETTFRNIWKTFNKNLNKNWQSVEFQFNNQNILVCRHWLKETNFNFELSHEIQ